MAEEMAIVELDRNLSIQIRRQVLEPVVVIASERDIQCDDVFNLSRMDSAIADCGACGGESM